jgi:hypothetical protein
VEGKKIYLQPKGTVLNTICDIVELTRGRSFGSDSANGITSAHMKMYGYKWDVHFLVEDIGKNRSCVTVGIEGERRDKRKEIRSVFALLDSMLLIDAEIEFADKEQSAEAEIVYSDNAES